MKLFRISFILQVPRKPEPTYILNGNRNMKQDNKYKSSRDPMSRCKHNFTAFLQIRKTMYRLNVELLSKRRHTIIFLPPTKGCLAVSVCGIVAPERTCFDAVLLFMKADWIEMDFQLEFIKICSLIHNIFLFVRGISLNIIW